MASGGTAPYTYLWAPGGQTTVLINNLSAGTYSVTVTDANGCSVTSTATVTQPASALSATSVSTNQIQGGAMGSVNVTISGGTSPYTSLWSNSATTEDLGSVAAGVYSCTITDANGCTQTIADTVNLVTGIGSVENTVGINLYPNPTKDVVTLDLTLSEASNVSVEVYNVTGQFISKSEHNNILSTKFVLDFTNEAVGVYYAKIKVNETTITRRIVVTR